MKKSFGFGKNSFGTDTNAKIVPWFRSHTIKCKDSKNAKIIKIPIGSDTLPQK